jgi:hypothetical protein
VKRRGGACTGHVGAMPSLKPGYSPTSDWQKWMKGSFSGSVSKLRIYRRSHPDFPYRAICRHFKSVANMHHRLAEWAGAKAEYADVAAMLADRVSSVEPEGKRSPEGFVYLIRWGANCKIGRGDQLERRVKQVRTGLPDSGSLVHAIRTDDPPGYRGILAPPFRGPSRSERGVV